MGLHVNPLGHRKLGSGSLHIMTEGGRIAGDDSRIDNAPAMPLKRHQILDIGWMNIESDLECPPGLPRQLHHFSKFMDLEPKGPAAALHRAERAAPTGDGREPVRV